MKAKFGAIITAGVGKLGGATITKSRQGVVFKNKMSRVNGLTSSQVTMRQRINILSKAWALLLESERFTWVNAVKDYPKSNSFGDKVLLSAYNLFLKINLQLLLIGQTIINSAPIKSQYSSIISAHAYITTGIANLLIYFNPQVPANVVYKIYASKALPPSINYCSDAYRYIGLIPASSTSPYDIASLYIAKFGAIGLTGQHIFFKITPVSQSTGCESMTCSFITLINEVSDMLTANLTITSAQLLANATIELIPAPGPGKIIVPLGAMGSLNFVSSPYTGTGKIDPRFRGSSISTNFFPSASLNSAATFQRVFPSNSSTGWCGGLSTSSVNQAIDVVITGSIANGNSSISVTFLYQIIDV